MADEYRSAIGFVFAGPWNREVTTQGGSKTVVEYMLSAVGLNGDAQIKISFWDDVPAFVQNGAALLISGKFSTYEGKDKNGDAKITKTINVNKVVELGSNGLVRSAANAAPVKRKASKPVEADLDDDLGF